MEAKLLAQQAGTRSLASWISEIRTPSGTSTAPDEINSQFKSFYSELYSSESSPLQWEGPDPLGHICFPQVDPSFSEVLAAPITVLEIVTAIKSLPGGKSPGPDRFTAEFFKSLPPSCLRYLADMYNESLEVGRLPGTLLEATITLILKPDKDPLECGSYRPISLLNVDLKILSKVLALRLQRDLFRTHFEPLEDGS